MLMAPNTIVIIATKGRPEHVSRLLDALARQTVPPDRIIVSASNRDDVADIDGNNVQTLFGTPGLVAQRNRALNVVRKTCDIVVFFDDDFVPSRFWIENLQRLFVAQTDIVCVTGQVLIDGITRGGLEWSVGRSVVDKVDSSIKRPATSKYTIKEDVSPYGCNMAYRANVIERLSFDERLILHGWLEDRDFAFRIGTWGRMIWTDAVWGVHLGTTQARSAGLKFGYSQIVNPWYLMTKGSMTPQHACRNILRAFVGNTFGLCLPKSQVDRLGRLKGNMAAINDIVRRRWAPEKIAEL